MDYYKLSQTSPDVKATPVYYLVVHTSANPDGYGGHHLTDLDIGNILNTHISGRKWRTVGYHYVITTDGRIQKGRYDSQSGAHATEHGANSCGLGICYVGGYAPVQFGTKPPDKDLVPKDTRTQQQKISLVLLLYLLKRKYPQAQVLGHKDLGAPKACPCFNAKSEYEWITAGTEPPEDAKRLLAAGGVKDWRKPYSLDKIEDYGVGKIKENTPISLAYQQTGLSLFAETRASNVVRYASNDSGGWNKELVDVSGRVLKSTVKSNNNTSGTQYASNTNFSILNDNIGKDNMDITFTI